MNSEPPDLQANLFCSSFAMWPWTECLSSLGFRFLNIRQGCCEDWMGSSIKGFAYDLGWCGYAGSAKSACGLRLICPDSPHSGWRWQRHFDVGLQQDPGKPFPLSFLVGSYIDHPCKIPFCGSLGWEGPSSTTLETGTIYSFLVSCQTPYHKATRTGFCFMNFTELSVSTQSFRSFFIATLWWHEQAPEQRPHTWVPLLRVGGAVCGISSCFLTSRWAFRLCWRTYSSSSFGLLCGVPTLLFFPLGPHSSNPLGHRHALAFSCLWHIQHAPSLRMYSGYVFLLPISPAHRIQNCPVWRPIGPVILF